MEITKEELEKLYYSNTNEELCKILSVSKPTLIKYLSIAGIELKGKRWNFKKSKINIKKNPRKDLKKVKIL